MRVYLLDCTNEPDNLVANIAKLSRSKNFNFDMTEKEMQKMIENLKKWGHESPFEHTTFTFYVEGISRACSHQLVRHRMASYLQTSQRYINEESFEYVVPDSIKENKYVNSLFKGTMETLDMFYSMLLKHNIPKEDARYVLPNACTTNIIVTMNSRSLFNFFNLRLAKDSQWEIRELASRVLQIVKDFAPEIFKNYEGEYKDEY